MYVVGFFVAFKKSSLTADQLNNLRQDEEVQSLFFLDQACTDFSIKYELKCLMKSGSSVEVFIFGHQGKSKYCGIWKLDDMLASNNNLIEQGPERNADHYVIPHTGIGKSLRAKVIVVQVDLHSSSLKS